MNISLKFLTFVEMNYEMEEVIIRSSTKEGQYKEILTQIESLIASESDCIANMANICAIIKEVFNFWWVGFYIVKESEKKGSDGSEKGDKKEAQLVLGPFQGPLACTRIGFGKGVCGTAWARKETIIVEDVDKFPGHIACSSSSRSEIVVPLIKGEKDGEVWAVLDIDSEHLNHFDDIDLIGLEKITKLLSQIY